MGTISRGVSMAKKKPRKQFSISYPTPCVDCGIQIEKPTFDTELGAIRPYPIFRNKKIQIVCSKCKPDRELPQAWIDQYGNTSKNGMPVDKNKRTTTLVNAHGFRKASFKNGKKVVKYVRRK